MTAALNPETAGLALDTIFRKPVKGIPSWLLHDMDHAHIERLAGAAPGAYAKDPAKVYLAKQVALGTCMIDQWIPTNPLTMGAHGFENKEKGATTGAHEIVVDGMRIDSPEDVAAHMERFVFPQLRQAAAEFDEEAHIRKIVAAEAETQAILAPTILKVPYGVIRFPGFAYSRYGYANYFMAFALYPDVIERHFSLQADFALRVNRAIARAWRQQGWPPLLRLDHDMADSRGTLANIRDLDRLWFPHFARCLKPLLNSDVNLIWHCDGNLMQMVPRLLDVGLRGFQGFQYEAGMDYESICKMKCKDGRDLFIIGGVSVTDTLPHGTPDDVRRQLKWLVDNGPKTGLFLGGSSSITPGVPWENICALREGLRYYREHGRRQ